MAVVERAIETPVGYLRDQRRRDRRLVHRKTKQTVRNRFRRVCAVSHLGATPGVVLHAERNLKKPLDLQLGLATCRAWGVASEKPPWRLHLRLQLRAHGVNDRCNTLRPPLVTKI